MAGGDPLEVIFLIVSMFAEIYLYLFLVLKLYQLKRDGPLNFYLTDFWAVVVGLAPSYIVIIKIIQSHKATTSADLSPAATLLILQILGMFGGRIMSRVRSGEKMPRRLDQFLWIFAGALHGCLLAGLMYYATCLNCFAMIIALPFWFAFVFSKPKPES